MMKTWRICTGPQLEMEFEKKPMPALQDLFQVCEEILVKPRKIQQAAPWSETEWSVQRPRWSRRVNVCAWRNKKDCRRSICALIGSSSSCDRAPHGVLPVLGLLSPSKFRDGFPGAPPRLSARRWLVHRARRDVGCPHLLTERELVFQVTGIRTQPCVVVFLNPALVPQWVLNVRDYP